MSRLSRRGVLGGVAAVALAADPSKPALAAIHSDADLIRACARYLELERIMDDPAHPDQDLDCDELPEWPEFLAVRDQVVSATPSTAAGMAALAHLALTCNMGTVEGDWADNDALRISRALLLLLVGPDLARDARRLHEDVQLRREEAAAAIAARPAPVPPPPLTREEEANKLRDAIDWAEGAVVTMRGRLSELENPPYGLHRT